MKMVKKEGLLQIITIVCYQMMISSDVLFIKSNGHFLGAIEMLNMFDPIITVGASSALQ
jgi:hypothetical protein